MGLGKTVQILALLEFLRTSPSVETPYMVSHMVSQKEKTLLIIPASLLCNWQNEAKRFTPKLRYNVIHANNRNIDLDSADLFITTYGMVMRLAELKNIYWNIVILDEAQAIKNTSTKQAKAIKELNAKYRIAMTGTPIENRLSDLWSIFDFLNKGLLGSTTEFTNFTKRLKEDSTGYARLREIVNPFILRRLKTDKSVIADLPDKVEIEAFTQLTKKQVVLYNGLVKELEKALADTEMSKIARKGLILASIMKFKQICNHPDQYLGQSGYDYTHSGKFEKLAEICETIREKHEKVIVFTQFKEMTEPLAKYLTEVFGRHGLVLHGSVAVKKRGELVTKFNSEEYIPFMILSLKAGGFGLNLTSANHVIHFDRWWNPAIENQATDRAFRIGQKKNVIVHKFITTGTIEEKIAFMLSEKQKLADDIIVASGENWITEMNNKDLIKLFKLDNEAKI
jgi:non-specific serine/threonine protein kinase